MLRDIELRGVGSFSPRDISSIAWSLSSLGAVEHRVSLFHDIAVESRTVARHFTLQGICNLLLAFARAAEVPGLRGPEVDELFVEAALQARARLAECNDQDLGCLCYALALYGVPSSGPLRQATNGLFVAVADKLLRPAPVLGDAAGKAPAPSELESLRSNYLCLVLWGFARAKFHRPALYTQLAAAVIRRWETEPVQSQQVVSLAWALATTKTLAPELFGALARAALPLLPQFSLRELTGTAWAFSYAKAKDKGLFAEIAALLHPR